LRIFACFQSTSKVAWEDVMQITVIVGCCLSLYQHQVTVCKEQCAP